jgi:uncharacterized protein YbjQ (UPF0145 family)
MPLTFEEFRDEQFRKNPELRRASEAYLRQLYQDAAGSAATSMAAAQQDRRIAAVLLTTASSLEGYRITRTIDVVSAECAFGINVLRDLFAAVSDFFGGRSESTQKVLRDARITCLRELRREAVAVGANAVIGVRLDYSEFTGHGKSMLFLVATATAVDVTEVR